MTTPKPSEVEERKRMAQYALDCANGACGHGYSERQEGTCYDGHVGIEALAFMYRAQAEELVALKAEANKVRSEDWEAQEKMIDSLRAQLEDAKLCYKSAERLAEMQTNAYQNAMANAERMFNVCSLAVRANEVVFDDPGDAVRWGEAVNDYKESTERKS